MKIQIQLNLDEQEITLVQTSSIERLLRNAARFGKAGEVEPTIDMARYGLHREDASTLWQDCEELLPVIRKIWLTVQSAIFLELSKDEKGG